MANVREGLVPVTADVVADLIGLYSSANFQDLSIETIGRVAQVADGDAAIIRDAMAHRERESDSFSRTRVAETIDSPRVRDIVSSLWRPWRVESLRNHYLEAMEFLNNDLVVFGVVAMFGDGNVSDAARLDAITALGNINNVFAHAALNSIAGNGEMPEQYRLAALTIQGGRHGYKWKRLCNDIFSDKRNSQTVRSQAQQYLDKQ